MKKIVILLIIMWPVTLIAKEYWTSIEVTSGTGVEKCQPLAKLPKKFKEHTKFNGYITTSVD